MAKRRGQWTGVCQNAILRRVSGGEYIGTVPELAGTIGHPEKRVWLALVGLAERRLVRAARAGKTLRVSITRSGLQVLGR